MNQALEYSGADEHESGSVKEALKLCYRTSRGVGGLESTDIVTGGGGGCGQQCSPVICQAFAEVITSTCKWVIVSTTVIQMLGVPNGPSQSVLNGVLPATPPPTGNVLEQRHLSKPLQYTAFSNGIESYRPF